MVNKENNQRKPLVMTEVRERERERRERESEEGGHIVVYCIVLHFVQCGPFILGKPISMNIVEPMQYPMRIARAWLTII